MKSIENNLSLAIGTSVAEHGKVSTVFVKAFLMGHTIGRYRRDITEQEMEYINALPTTVYRLIKMDDINNKVSITLSMAIIKILHNACVDILKEEPTLTAYKAALEELEEVILDQESKTVRGVITAPKSALEQTIEFATKMCEKNNV
jgi:hypothetical protein